jgi:hypothetical protein
VANKRGPVSRFLAFSECVVCGERGTRSTSTKELSLPQEFIVQEPYPHAVPIGALQEARIVGRSPTTTTATSGPQPHELMLEAKLNCTQCGQVHTIRAPMDPGVLVPLPRRCPHCRHMGILMESLMPDPSGQ